MDAELRRPWPVSWIDWCFEMRCILLEVIITRYNTTKDSCSTGENGKYTLVQICTLENMLQMNCYIVLYNHELQLKLERQLPPISCSCVVQTEAERYGCV